MSHVNLKIIVTDFEHWLKLLDMGNLRLMHSCNFRTELVQNHMIQSYIILYIGIVWFAASFVKCIKPDLAVLV